MRIVALLCWLVAAFALQASAQEAVIGSGVIAPKSSGGGCSQATTFLARTSGLSGGQRTAATTFICAEVSNGNWAKLDAFWFASGVNTTDDALNWVSTSFGLTKNGTVTNWGSSPGSGWVGNGSTGYLDTGLVLLAGTTQYATNSASLGTCIVNSRTSGGTTRIFGLLDGTYHSEFQPFSGGSTANWQLNSTLASNAYSTTNAQGAWTLLRTGATAEALYLNGTSVNTNTSGTSGGPFSHDLFLLALDSSGSAANFSADTMAYAYVGSGSINVSALTADLTTLWHAWGGSGC